LKQLPAHHLKIDREFVGDVLTNQRSRAVITGIVSLARSFGQRTIAEGVESQATLEVLRELGVDLAQGYLIGRPRLLGPDLSLPARSRLAPGTPRFR
jgi:EAL domain-containing protein (putative c-di-GMP-specific phosphodiesterase class I)